MKPENTITEPTRTPTWLPRFKPVTMRNFIVIITIIMFSTLFSIAAPRLIPGTQMMENWLTDLRATVMAKPQPVDPRIILTTITEGTLATLPYRSPIDRGFLIKLLEHLKSAGVRAVGIDILFDQPTEPAKDTALKQIIASFPVPIIIANTRAQGILTKDQQTYLANFNKGLTTGDVNLIKDISDGTVRRIYTHRAGSNPRQLGFVTALLHALDKPVPTENIALAYRARPKGATSSFKSFPAHASLFLPKAWFVGKIVLIGADLPMSDRHKTTFAAALGTKDGTIPGINIHAHALSQLLDNRRVPTLSSLQIGGFILLLATLGIVITLIDASIFAKGLMIFAAFTALWVNLFLAYKTFAFPLPFLAPNIALATGFSLGIAYLGHHDRQQKKFIQDTFSKYLSPTIVNLLIAEPSKLKAGGERRDLTYLFTDLADFTTLTEQSDPEQLVDLLNAYIDGMCTIVIKHEGTVDKVIGDAIVAFFGAPIIQEDHANRAIACALEMDAFAQAFAEQQRSMGMQLGVTRIGVHSGEATIGNFGGKNFFDYTAFGDTVNTAARLESINKHLGTRICISEVSAKNCPEITYRPVGTLILKGKTKGLNAVEPLDSSEKSPNIDKDTYITAFAAMKKNEESAIEAFQRIVDLKPNDALAAFHLKRLKRGETGTIIELGAK